MPKTPKSPRNIFAPSAVKKREERPGPPYSATQFNEGKTMLGNDGNTWIVVANKNGVKRWKRVSSPKNEAVAKTAKKKATPVKKAKASDKKKATPVKKAKASDKKKATPKEKECKYGLSNKISPKTGKRLCNKKPVVKKATPVKKDKTSDKKKATPKKKVDDGQYNFSKYIYAVLKQVHPDTQNSEPASKELNSIINQLARKIINKADKMKDSTISSRTINNAVTAMFPENLGRHAISEGTKAVTKYASSNDIRGDITKLSGLTFPVITIEGMIGRNTNKEVDIDAAIYLAAVLEYVTAELLELGGNAARDNRKNRISVEHIAIAIDLDEELKPLLKDAGIKFQSPKRKLAKVD